MSKDPDKLSRTQPQEPSEFGGRNIGVSGNPPGQPEPYRAKAASLGGEPPKHQRRVR